MDKSKRFGAPVSFSLRPSKIKIKLLILLHLLALSAVVFNGLSLWLRIVLLSSVSVSLIVWIYCYTSEQPVKLRFCETDGWCLGRQDESLAPVTVLPDSVVSVGGIFMTYQLKGKKRSLAIFKDALSAEDFARLTVMLKTTTMRQE